MQTVRYTRGRVATDGRRACVRHNFDDTYTIWSTCTYAPPPPPDMALSLSLAHSPFGSGTTNIIVQYSRLRRPYKLLYTCYVEAAAEAEITYQRLLISANCCRCRCCRPVRRCRPVAIRCWPACLFPSIPGVSETISQTS